MEKMLTDAYKLITYVHDSVPTHIFGQTDNLAYDMTTRVLVN